MRGGVERAGRQTSRCRPGFSFADVDQTICVEGRSARIVSVRTASIRTVAARSSRNETIAASRNRSPFGLTVVSRRRSPWKGESPFVTRRPWSDGPG